MRQSLQDRSPAPQIDKLAAARGVAIGFVIATAMWGLVWWLL